MDKRHHFAVYKTTGYSRHIIRPERHDWEYREMAKDDAPRRMISTKDVLKAIPVSRSTLARMIETGSFPKAVAIAQGRKAWFLDEVLEWQKRVDRQRGPINETKT